MKIKEQVWISFCDHSWKMFQNEAAALDWADNRDRFGELWLVTSATIEYSHPKATK